VGVCVGNFVIFLCVYVCVIGLWCFRVCVSAVCCCVVCVFVCSVIVLCGVFGVFCI